MFYTKKSKNTNFVTLNYFCSMKRYEYFIFYIIGNFKKFYTLLLFFILKAPNKHSYLPKVEYFEEDYFKLLS